MGGSTNNLLYLCNRNISTFMNKKETLRLCDIALLIVAILVLASSIQMEASKGEDFAGIPFVGYMIVHVVLAIAMFALVIYHLYLHFGWKEWIAKLRKTPKRATRILSVVTLIALLTGVAAFIVLMVNMRHTSLGGVHGKFGFLMIVIALGHTIKRIRFLKK